MSELLKVFMPCAMRIALGATIESAENFLSHFHSSIKKEPSPFFIFILLLTSLAFASGLRPGFNEYRVRANEAGLNL